ncbi:MAG: PAS domain S-box protein, partial [Candidatus Ferrigenium altingense]
MKLQPGRPADTENRNAFAVAGSIVHNVLHTGERGFAQTLGEVIRAAFDWPEVYCHFTGRAAHLAGRRKLPEDWRSLVERIECGSQAAWLPADGNEVEPIQLGCLLLAQGEAVGVLCVRAPLAALPALQTLAGLIAATLLDRLQFDERKRGLLDSEDKLARQQQILDQIHDSVIAMDLSGYITGWNKGAEQQFGYTAEEAIGKNILF